MKKITAMSKKFPAATEIFRQDSAARFVYLIERGIVKLLHLGEGGKEIIIGLRYPGWFLGAAPAILQESYTVTALTLTRCQMRLFPATLFIDMIKTDADFSWNIQQHLGRGIHQYINRLTDIGSLPARQRLDKLLRELGAAMEPDEPKGITRLPLPLKQWEIAQLIAVTPQYLNRLLKEKEATGMISREKGRVIVCNPERLFT